MNVRIESDVTPTVTFHRTVSEADQYVCTHLHKSACVSNKELEKGHVVLWWAQREFGFHCGTENHTLRKRVIGFPLHCIPANSSAYHSFFFFFFRKTAQMYGMEEEKNM